MKKLVFLFIILISNPLLSQLQREVLYRLEPNEIVYENEYTALISLDNTKKFSVLIRDTLSNKYRLVFNGKTVGSYTGNKWGPDATIKSIDLNKPNGYSYITYRGKHRDINIEGKKINNLENGSFVSWYWNDQNNDYYYNLLGERYLNKSGKTYSVEGKKQYATNKNDILWVSKYEYSYQPEYNIFRESQLYLNSDFLGEFDLIKSRSGILWNLDESGYAFCYTQNDANYISFNGSVSRLRPDNRILADFKITGNDYYFVLDDGLYKNDVLAQNFNTEMSEWAVNTKGDVLYTDGENLYLNSLLVEQNQGATNIRDLSIDNSGNISYTYSSKECSHCYFEVINQNEKEYLDYGISGGAELSSTDGNHHLKSKWNYDYVVIDGAPCGNAPALAAWYDSKNNCFYWNSFENNELVFYQFKL